MGKSLPSTTKLQEFARFVASGKLRRSKQVKPVSKPRVVPSPKPRGVRVESEQLRVKMEESSTEGGGRRRRRQEEEEQQGRVPLAEVVSDCVKRWFQDTLKEAKAGDSAMQVLVGQMYYSGYGVHRDAQKGRAWISRASKSRSSVWKVSDKHPGYNASDSDSDDMKSDTKSDTKV